MSGPRNSILVCTIRTRLHTAQLHTARSAIEPLRCRNLVLLSKKNVENILQLV
jgi:hypothetical protein